MGGACAGAGSRVGKSCTPSSDGKGNPQMRLETLWVLLVLILPGCIFAPPPPPMPRLRGPEATGLVERLSGWLVLPARLETRGLSAIRVIALPSREDHVIRPAMPDGKTYYIHALGGPDREGRIAYIQQAMGEPYLVKTVRVDGSAEREIARVAETTPG